MCGFAILRFVKACMFVFTRNVLTVLSTVCVHADHVCVGIHEEYPHCTVYHVCVYRSCVCWYSGGISSLASDLVFRVR